MINMTERNIMGSGKSRIKILPLEDVLMTPEQIEEERIKEAERKAEEERRKEEDRRQRDEEERREQRRRDERREDMFMSLMTAGLAAFTGGNVNATSLARAIRPREEMEDDDSGPTHK